jgi:hypothetical protein
MKKLMLSGDGLGCQQSLLRIGGDPQKRRAEALEHADGEVGHAPKPFPDVVHGCLLEGMALALERRFEPFSQGRGSITQQRVEEIEAIAARHAIYLAPLEIIPLLPWQCCNNPQT